MASSLDTLDFIAPEFASEPTSVKETALEMAAQQMSQNLWGELYVQGAAHLAAHLLTLRERRKQGAASGGAAAGGITSMSAGDASLSFGGRGSMAKTASDEALMTTSYGEDYLRLRAKLSGTAGFIADGSNS